MTKMYADFGDVRDDDFRAWWSAGNRGGMLFAEPPAAVKVAELESKVDWDEAWSRDTTMVVVVPLDWSKRDIKKSFDKLLSKRHTRQPGKIPMRGKETSSAKYPLARNFNINALRTGLAVYDAVEAAKQEAEQSGQRRKSYYEIGVALKLVPSALPKAKEELKGARDADKVNVMTVAVSRYYKRAAQIVEKTISGEFP